MATLSQNLDLEKCPHCSIDKPNLRRVHNLETSDYQNHWHRFWGIYLCNRCGGLTTAWAWKYDINVEKVYPSATSVDINIPTPARDYLQQAIDSIHAPAGAVMLSASAVDAMLKTRGYKEGSLYSRIDKACKDHLITEEMALWAHEVRLDANDQRHADENFILPSEENAQKSVEFVLALGEFLFVLPSRIQRGLSNS